MDRKSVQRISEGFLFTDQYQLAMAQLYFRMGLHENQSLFEHFFRAYPDYGNHKAGFCINAGLEWFIDWMKDTYCTDEDIDQLRSHQGQSGSRIFQDDFLTWLRANGSFDCVSLQSLPEGRVVHPNVPVNVVTAPLAMAQILETPLLNQLNFQILIATKAARIFESGRGQLLLEFGMRRAHGFGANAGVRAALIGGASFSSNVGMSHALGFPPKGTNAHSMIQTFIALGQGELAAFQAFADIYPDDCILLVDTINTLESGVPNAIKVFESLKRKGHNPVGVRLDSGDLAYLSIQVAKMLEKAGFPDAKIVLSNQLDELTILQILAQIQQEAPDYGVDADALINRLVYGVGSRMISSQGYSALDGVYKLVALHDGKWIPAIKISETAEKTINPGKKLVWRIYDNRGFATADVISVGEEMLSNEQSIHLRHPVESSKYRILQPGDVSNVEPLLVDVMKEGKQVYDFPALEECRDARREDVQKLDPGVRRIINPHIYHVSLSQRLWDLKNNLIESARNG